MSIALGRTRLTCEDSRLDVSVRDGLLFPVIKRVVWVGLSRNCSRREEAGQAHFSRPDKDVVDSWLVSQTYSRGKNEPVPGRERLRVSITRR